MFELAILSLEYRDQVISHLRAREQYGIDLHWLQGLLLSAFVWSYPGIGIVGISQTIVRSRAYSD